MGRTVGAVRKHFPCEVGFFQAGGKREALRRLPFCWPHCKNLENNGLKPAAPSALGLRAGGECRQSGFNASQEVMEPGRGVPAAPTLLFWPNSAPRGGRTACAGCCVPLGCSGFMSEKLLLLETGKEPVKLWLRDGKSPKTQN